MKTEFDLLLAMIVIDTIVASAGYTKGGEENDAAVTQAIMSRQTALSHAVGALVLGVDHFGKAALASAFGRSTKEQVNTPLGPREEFLDTRKIPV